jgi:FkbM family methyltransferase
LPVELARLHGWFKDAIRGLLATRGLEVRRVDRGVRRTLPAVLAHYRKLGLAPRTVIDVGVGAGTPELYQGFPGARIVLVEPLIEWNEDLELWRRERRAEIVPAAAGARAGEVTIAVHRVPACSSMLGSRRGEQREQEQRSVPMVRLDDVAHQRGLVGPFVVKVDVEGAELEVLAGAPRLLAQAQLILLEVSLFELVPGAPQFHQVVAWMQESGFVVADLYNGHNRLLDGALAQLDVAFVREDGPFRRDHAYATPAQAEELYRSWGLGPAPPAAKRAS